MLNNVKVALAPPLVDFLVVVDGPLLCESEVVIRIVVIRGV